MVDEIPPDRLIGRDFIVSEVLWPLGGLILARAVVAAEGAGGGEPL